MVSRSPSYMRKKHVFCCREHANAFQGTLRGAETANWRGGIKRNGAYVEWNSAKFSSAELLILDAPGESMFSKQGYVLVHRAVMALHLRRPLTSDEEVHHKNLNPLDNRLSNLKLTTNGKHQGVHSRLTQRAKQWQARALRAEQLLAQMGAVLPIDEETP